MIENPEERVRNPSFHPGACIADKYVVERLIGEGGLGVVVAARNVQLDQIVAIKYLRPSALGTRTVAERFLREARLAAKIRSEHIVHVYDVGTLPDGAPYMVMEYLTGMDLGRLLSANGPLPADRAIDYVLQACEALAEAHAAGIVHRDIKPDNLFIATSSAGTPILKVLDFGISKMSSKRMPSGAPEVTEVGDKLGTPVYMSPEQLLDSGDVDARTDVWAIGVVLYELLTGTLPFDGDSLPALCTAILHRPPVPLFLARPDLPVQLQRVIEQCLAKDVAGRFQNVAELAQELRPLAGPAGRERIEEVIRVTLGAGDSVRPSALPPGASSMDALREVLTPAPPADRQVVTTGSGVASWAPTKASGEVFGWIRGRLRMVAAGAGVFTVAFGIAALTGALSPRSKVAERADSPGVSAARPVEQTDAVTPPALPVDEPAASRVNVAPMAASGVAPALPPPGRKELRTTPRQPGSGSPKPANKVDSNAVINPFE